MKQTNYENDLGYVILIIVLLVYFLSMYYFFIYKSPIESDMFDKSDLQIPSKISFNDAMISNNISNCNNMIETHLIEICRLRLIDCFDDDCYFDKARFEMNETMCFEIDNIDKRTGCSAAIKRSNILENAVLENNIEICNEFEDEPNIMHCQDNYYIAKRYNNNDLSYCYNIKNEVILNECLKE